MRPYLFLLLLGGSQLCLAQLPAYHAQIFGVEEGLEAGYISSVFQDQNQFLWVAAGNTLQRFDGRHVYKESFAERIAQALCDRKDRIWALSGSRIWRNRENSWGLEEILFDTLSRGTPSALFQLKDRPFCVLSSRGLFAWDETQAEFRPLDEPLPVPLPAVGSHRFDTCGATIFYPAKEGFVAADLSTGRHRSMPMSKPIMTVCALTPDLAVVTYFDRHSVLLDFHEGVARPMDAVHYGLSEEVHRLSLMDAQPLGDSLFLVTTGFGACTYDLRQDRFVRHRIFAGGKPIGLEESLIRIYLDDNGVFWAHNSSNILAFRSIRNSIGLLRNYHDDPTRSWSNRVIGFAEDGKGNLWFGGFNGFNRLDLRSGQIEPHPPVDDATDRLSHLSVRGLAYDGRYLLLGPTDKGMWLYDPATDRFRRPSYADDSVRTQIEREFINGIFPLPDGNFLICGRFQAYLLRKDRYLLEPLSFPGSKDNVTGACLDPLGRLWLTTTKGIHVLDRQYRYLYGFPSEQERVFCIYTRSANEMVVGTEKGLRLLTLTDAGGSWSKVEGPLEQVSIISIYRDERGRFWFGADRGLFLADAELQAFRQFDYTDNIQSELYHLFASYRAADGLLFLGGRNGINYFYPENIELETRPLAVTIQTLAIGEGDSVLWDPGRQLTLPHQQNTLTLEVVVPYYNNAGKLQYRYRLRQNGRWIDTGGSPRIRLTDLPPGEYQLAVAASVDGSQWHAAPEIQLTIRPEFWQRPLFWAGLIGLIALLLYLLIRQRDRTLRKRQRQTLELEKLKTTALQYELETEQVINYFNRSIARAESLEQALWDVAQGCIARLDLEDCVIYLLDAERQVLQQIAAWGEKSSPNKQIVAPIEIPLGQGIVGTVAQSGKAEMVPDTTVDPRYIPDVARRRSELAVPILDEGRVIGVIDTEHSEKNFYTSWHLQLFTAIASLCSNKIALARSEEARRQALLETLDSERKAAEAKLQSLRLQMNPHFLFNALNSIQELILTGKTDGAAMYLSKFSKLLRLVLTHSDRELLSLREEIEILQLYVELESLRFYDTFEYRIELEPGIDPDEYQLPTLLVQPFVENAIWHGLLHKEGRRRLRVHFTTDEEDRLVCTVEDNGIGRKAAEEARTAGWHTGKGMSSSAERLEVLNGRHGQHNLLEIVDLVAADGSAAGTLVRITLD